MQVHFMRWCIDPNGRTACSINPVDVVSTEHYSDAYGENIRWLGDKGMPYRTKIILRQGKEYLVQGHIAEIIEALNKSEYQR